MNYSHMCKDGHIEIGHNDSEHEQCPMCRALADNERLREKLAIIGRDRNVPEIVRQYAKDMIGGSER